MLSALTLKLKITKKGKDRMNWEKSRENVGTSFSLGEIHCTIARGNTVFETYCFELSSTMIERISSFCRHDFNHPC